MSYGLYNWSFENLNIYNDVKDEPKSVDVEFQLCCTNVGYRPSGLFGPPELYDPGEPPTWEINTIEIVFDTVKTLKITEEQFGQLFPDGDDMINNAIEAAIDNGVIEYDEE